MFKRKKKWSAGDFFGVPLSNGQYALGQVVSYEAEAMNSVICAFFLSCGELHLIRTEEASVENLLSIMFVTRDLLDSGGWPILASGRPIEVGRFLSVDQIRKNGFVGVKITGSSNASAFMNACFGMLPWNGMHDQHYFDKMLVDPNRRPGSIVLKA